MTRTRVFFEAPHRRTRPVRLERRRESRLRRWLLDCEFVALYLLVAVMDTCERRWK